jgi:hypothetical protein
MSLPFNPAKLHCRQSQHLLKGCPYTSSNKHGTGPQYFIENLQSPLLNPFKIAMFVFIVGMNSQASSLLMTLSDSRYFSV